MVLHGVPQSPPVCATRLLRDRRGLAALETAILMPVFLALMFSVVQVGIYFMMQSALDAGVLNTAAALRLGVVAGSAYAPPTAASLKTTVVAGGTGLLTTANVIVDVRQLTTLSAAAVPVADGTTDWGGSGSILVLRAQSTMTWFTPGTFVVTASSMAIVRRPNY